MAQYDIVYADFADEWRVVNIETGVIECFATSLRLAREWVQEQGAAAAGAFENDLLRWDYPEAFHDEAYEPANREAGGKDW